MKVNNIKGQNITRMRRLLSQVFLLLIFLAAISGSSCKTPKSQGEEPVKDILASGDDKQEVSIIRLVPSDFTKEIITNGRLEALTKADLRFRSSENILKIYVRNGERVNKDEKIAELNSFILKYNLEQSRDQYEKSILELQDVLIGQGYTLGDTASVPDAMMKTARVKSGYDKARADMQMAQYNLDESVLRAPYSGVVANLFAREKNMIKQDEVFCTIIDDTSVEARFTVLESELSSVHSGQQVRVIPYSSLSDEFYGQVTKINPVVDQNGVVKIDALIRNNNGSLFEGMNVKVIIEDKVPDQLVIPKQAIVLRSGKQVVFTYTEGKAKWIYVKTGLENSTSIIVTEGLQTGDSVIYDGNLNLAHDTRVILN
jgi:RND family efflux transporter MFP subunit